MSKSQKDTFGLWTTLIPETMSTPHKVGEPMKILIEPKMDLKTAAQINAKPSPGYSAEFARGNGYVFDLDRVDWPYSIKTKAMKIFGEHRMIWRITSELLEEDEELRKAEKALEKARTQHQEVYREKLANQGMGIVNRKPQEKPQTEESKPDNK